MNIWIINPFDDIPGEGKSQRYWTLAQTLVLQGHSVVWWSSDFSHRRKAKRFLDNQHHSISFEVRLVWTPPYLSNVSFTRIWNHRCFGNRLYEDACGAVDSGELPAPDRVIASLPPMEGPIAALRLKKRYGCAVIADVMDAWPQTLLQVVPSWARGLCRLCLTPYFKMLSRACSESDAISAQSEAFAQLARNFGSRGSEYVCYLGAERPLETASSISSKEARRASDPIQLIYLGAMGSSYDLETVALAVGQLSEKGHHVKCTFVGDGEKRPILESMANSDMRFTGFLEGDVLHEELSKADIGIIPFFPESGVAVPYKAGEYLAYGLPVLSTLKGEFEELILKHKCGTTYDAGDVESLVAATERYISSPDLLQVEKRQALSCFESVFERGKIYPEFAAWICEQGAKNTD